ncbi:hypothetical protein NDN11_03135 [Acinetobacter sp. C26M]|uniref:hypothetical protein n=1 Tax=unclassified Acinetobacter TaxID=196816 RepID=UPI00141FA058|nr:MULTISPECIES: hypothetical protein [unclassified Acinetobacter]NIE98179.1 hypothetical protein [Acinetobacter sp. Tr-809]USA47142.1 hypothetical protein NDN11_03135 [Acinetobacter sp. C26M]USA50623.1 hypothetical protein NDN12_03135 [Acinetobacter sp. C26G]
MNQGVERNSYLKHWAIAMGLLLITAISCSLMQYFLGIDIFWFIVLAFIGSLSLIFSSLFAWLQLETGNSYFSSGVFVGFLSVYLLLYIYLDLTVSIDWAAVSAGEMQLTWYQKMVKSDLTFWIAFLFPFIFSVVHFSIRSQVAKRKK